MFRFAFQHFHDHISVEHDEKPPQTKFDTNRFAAAPGGGLRYGRMNV